MPCELKFYTTLGLACLQGDITSRTGAMPMKMLLQSTYVFMTY